MAGDHGEAPCKARQVEALMVFRLQPYSNYGTATPAVARTLLQGSDVLRVCIGTDEQKERAHEALHELGRQLVRCVEIRDDLAAQVKAGRASIPATGIEVPTRGALRLPGVPDLRAKAEAFLQTARLALAAAPGVLEPFYGVNFGHKFHSWVGWAKRERGDAHSLTTTFEYWEPIVKGVVDARNAVDHPQDTLGGRLFTVDFEIDMASQPPALIDPHWHLQGAPPSPILPYMDWFIEAGIVLGEDLLIALFREIRGSPLLELDLIPVAQRNPDNPRRLRVALAGHPPPA